MGNIIHCVYEKWNFSSVKDMDDILFVEEPDGESLVGVCLCGEAHIRNTEHDTSLGAVVISTQITLTHLRTTLRTQIITLPTYFTFISPQGYVFFPFFVLFLFLGRG